jgi:ribosome-binding protein aMBF1 (putative translation factor)
MATEKNYGNARSLLLAFVKKRDFISEAIEELGWARKKLAQKEMEDPDLQKISHNLSRSQGHLEQSLKV